MLPLMMPRHGLNVGLAKLSLGLPFGLASALALGRPDHDHTRRRACFPRDTNLVSQPLLHRSRPWSKIRTFANSMNVLLFEKNCTMEIEGRLLDMSFQDCGLGYFANTWFLRRVAFLLFRLLLRWGNRFDKSCCNRTRGICRIVVRTVQVPTLSKALCDVNVAFGSNGNYTAKIIEP